MYRFWWLRSLCGSGSSRQERRGPALRRRNPTRLMLESLEERLTPSGGNPMVTQTAGSYTALAAAIAADTAANTNYVVQINGNFTFNSGGQVSISKLGSGSTLTLSGQNGTNYTLTGNGNRLFAVASGQNVTFADLTLTGGTVTNAKGQAQGGAIEDLGGNVTLSKVVVQGNTVKGGTAQGGGVFVTGAGTVVLRDSILSDNSALGSKGADGTAPSMNGSGGGAAYGGGLYVGGSGWTVTLIGDTLSGNSAMGGSGGNGAAGTNATTANTSGGNGGAGGEGGDAGGGAAYFSVSNNGNGRLTILNNLGAPISDPSTMIDNTAQAGAGGNGGNGGNSTGTAIDSLGGGGGLGGTAEGGALNASGATGATLTVNIGNSAFYANNAAAGNDGGVGAFGTGGIFIPPPQPPVRSGPTSGPIAAGGGLALGNGEITIVNSTVAKNAVTNTAVRSSIGGVAFPKIPGPAWGGGIYDNDASSVTLDNNTIAQNTLQGGNTQNTPTATGAGVFVASGNPTLANNLIQGNQNLGSSASDLASSGIVLSNASDNFIGSVSASTVITTANFVSSTQLQLSTAVGVAQNGTATGGPIYYPLLPGVASIGAGSTSVLSTIAAVEGTTLGSATDALGNPLSSNGPLNLGAVQFPTPTSPSSSPSPSPSPSVLSPIQLMVAIVLDFDALTHQDSSTALSFLNAISEELLGQQLPSAANLIPAIEGDIAALVDLFFGVFER